MRVFMKSVNVGMSSCVCSCELRTNRVRPLLSLVFYFVIFRNRSSSSRYERIYPLCGTKSPRLSANRLFVAFSLAGFLKTWLEPIGIFGAGPTDRRRTIGQYSATPLEGLRPNK